VPLGTINVSDETCRENPNTIQAEVALPYTAYEHAVQYTIILSRFYILT